MSIGDATAEAAVVEGLVVVVVMPAADAPPEALDPSGPAELTDLCANAACAVGCACTCAGAVTTELKPLVLPPQPPPVLPPMPNNEAAGSGDARKSDVMNACGVPGSRGVAGTAAVNVDAVVAVLVEQGLKRKTGCVY